MSSVENPTGGSVTVPVIGLSVVVSLAVWGTDWVTSWPSEMGLGSAAEPESDLEAESELDLVAVEVGSLVESELSPPGVVKLPLPLVVSGGVGNSVLPFWAEPVGVVAVSCCASEEPIGAERSVLEDSTGVGG